MKTDAAPGPGARNFVVVALLLASLFGFFLLVTSHTPRGRLNVMQAGAVIFFLLAAVRWWSLSSADGSAPVSGEQGGQGLWVALALGAAVWSVSLTVGFINDDFGLIYGARSMPLRQFIHSQSGVFFRPLGYASIFLDHRIWGMWAPGYHLTNIALHLVTIAGIYGLCRELGGEEQVSGGAAMIYAVLPVQAETVAWVGCRFGLLSDALVVGAAWLYLRSRRKDCAMAYAGAAACFVLAALSKESAFVFPAMLIVFELLFVRERRMGRALAFVGLAAALFAVRWAMLGGIGGYTTPGGGVPATLQIGFKTFEGLLLRGPAVMLFGYNWLQPPLWAMVAVASLTGGVLLAAAWYSRGARLDGRIAILSLVWMIVSIAPAHPLLMIGADLTNSRDLHPGAAGLALLLAYVMGKGTPNGARRWLPAALVALLSVASLLNLAAWRWTSGLTQQVLSDVRKVEPEPPARAAFVIYGVPQTVRGVYLLHEGLNEALRLSYGREDINARHALPGDRGEVFAGPAIQLEWRGETPPVIVRRRDGATGN